MESSSLLSWLFELIRIRLDQLPALAIVAAVVMIVLGRLAPTLQRRFPRLWPRNADDRQSLLTDVTYLLGTPFNVALAQVMTSIGVVMVAIVIGRRLDPNLMDGFGPVARQPYWLMLLEAYVISDLMSYWTHRMAHTVPLLWRLHATHHSVEHLRGMSFARFHPLEVWELVPNLAVLFLLGFPVDVLAPIGPFGQLWAFFIHSNSRFSPRWLSYAITFPAYHRWHHSKYIEGHGWNFGGLLPLSDLLFGTYYYPKHEPESFGIADTAMPKTYLGQLVYPFRRTEAQSDVELETGAPGPT